MNRAECHAKLGDPPLALADLERAWSIVHDRLLAGRRIATLDRKPVYPSLQGNGYEVEGKWLALVVDLGFQLYEDVPREDFKP